MKKQSLKKQSLKKQSYILRTTIFAIFLLLAAGVGQAQDGVKVTVPFNFLVGTQSFSAGDYTLTSFSHNAKLLQTPNGQILTIISLPITVESREAHITPKLVFHEFGGLYFLAQIWDAGNPSGRQVLKSPVEIQLAKASQAPAQLVALSSIPQR